MALGYGGLVPANWITPAMVSNPQLMLGMKKAVKQFQRDYKHAVNCLTEAPMPSPFAGIIDGRTAPRKSLKVDGWIGPNTWAGFKWAYEQAAVKMAGGDNWKLWVQCGKDL